MKRAWDYLGVAGVKFLIALYELGGSVDSMNKVVAQAHLGHGSEYRALRILEDLGLVRSRRSGRVIAVELTEKGREIAKRLKEIDELMPESGSEAQSPGQ